MNSARKRCGATCSGCDSEEWRAAPSKPVSTACVSSTVIRSAETGYCSGKKRIASPRHKRLPDALSEDQVRHLLSGIRNPVHKTCLAVMYACGLRISEATTLEVSAIDRANQVLRIIGKGNKERLVPLPQPVLRHYVATSTTSIFAVENMSSTILVYSIPGALVNGRTACHQCIKQQAGGTGWNSDPT